MDVNADVLATPGLRRRISRWRSWWNKHELYPPSVDRWLRQRASFFSRETAHLHGHLDAFSVVERTRTAIAALQSGSAADAGRHVHRGFLLAFCYPFRSLER